MQHLEVSGAVRPIYGSLGVKRLMGVLSSKHNTYPHFYQLTAFFLDFVFIIAT